MTYTPTISDLCRRAVEDHQSRNSPTSWPTWGSHARLFGGLWGDRQIHELSRQEVEAWVIQRAATHAAGTVRHELAFLKQAFDLALEMGLTDNSPAHAMNKRVMKRIRQAIRGEWLRGPQEAQLRASYAEIPRGQVEWTVARFALLTGCRRGEQLHITRDHIRLTPGAETPADLRIPDEGKTGTRTVPMVEEALEIALKWAEHSERMGRKFIFWPRCRPGTNRWNHGNNYAWKVWHPRCLAAGLTDLEWRDLRRSFACRLIERKVPIFEVQKLLGHASPNQTLTYCQVDLAQLRQSVLKIY